METEVFNWRTVPRKEHKEATTAKFVWDPALGSDRGPLVAGSSHLRRLPASPAAAPATGGAGTATPAPGGGHGLVWVNTETHVYHKEGSRFYGTTKKGKYMSEAQAVKEGDRAAGKGE